jgi:hypothetical protein
VDSPVLGWLRETFRPILLNEYAEYPGPDEDDPLREVLLAEQERHENARPSAPPPQNAMLFCPLPGQVCYLKWLLTKYFADHVDKFHMFADMGNDKGTEMQLKFQDSHNASVFVMTPKVGGTSLNLTTTNHVVITQTL